METIDLGIAILVEGAVEAEACRLRSAIAETVEIDPLYSLDNLPHVTLFQGRFPVAVLDELKQAVAGVLARGEVPGIEFVNELYLSVVSRNVFWNVVIAPELVSFHMRVVTAVNQLRSGLLMLRYEDKLKSPDTSEQERELVSRYGIRFVGENYFPHITLAKLKKNSLFERLDSIQPALGMGTSCEKIVLGEIGYAGDLLEIVEVFPVKSKQ